jgi:preprotein translocase subunit SecG
MTTLLIILHVLVSLALIVIVLLQAGKGASIGASFGSGGAGAVFGPTGPSGIMGKVTAGVAIVFMLTSLSLAIIYSSPGAGSVMPATVEVPTAEQPAAEVPAAEQPAPAPQQ